MNKQKSKMGQVVTEYLMILTFVFVALALTNLKLDGDGNLQIDNSAGSKTIMQTMSDAFTVWMKDILIIISLPS